MGEAESNRFHCYFEARFLGNPLHKIFFHGFQVNL